MLDGAAQVRAGEHLAAAVERAGRRPTTGLVGTGLLLPALSKAGKDDLAYALLEHFAAQSRDGAFGQLGFGAVLEWMYDAIGGIALDPLAPAGRHVFVRPRPGGGLTSARAAYDSLPLRFKHWPSGALLPPSKRSITLRAAIRSCPTGR
jgi:alpha-L-rhamnosidase